MSLFLYLLLAHVLLDYPGQGEFLALGKKNNVVLMLVHCLMWSLGVAAVLDHFGAYTAGKLAFLFLGHWAMDHLKCQHLSRWMCGCWGDPLCEVLQHKQGGRLPWAVDPLGLPLIIDQLFHLFQLWAVCR